MLRNQIQNWRFEAATAATTDEAMAMVLDAANKGRPYDVAIIDFEKNASPTLELGKAIKSRRQINSTILLGLLPVDSDLEQSELNAAGFWGRVIKPVRQSVLFDSIVEAMACVSEPSGMCVQTEPDNPTLPAVALQPARILIAEDNRINQLVATEILSKSGYVCDTVGDGKKALEAALSGKYDLILMDCAMPEMDGFEATRQIRLAELADPSRPVKRIPIIALTANAIDGDREKCLAAGMDEYETKPLDIHHLTTTIQKLLKSPVPQPIGPTANQVGSAIGSDVLESNTTGPAPFEVDLLLERCMGQAQTVEMILNEFEKQAVADVEEMTRSMKRDDGDGLWRVAHALKGASGMLSAAALADLAYRLEQMGRAGTLNDADQLLAQLNQEVQRCVAYLPEAREIISSKTQNQKG
jgi:CheY-like chemotaxis protein/HPt (histidine-containing phosphotransfer) domain-containing protein